MSFVVCRSCRFLFALCGVCCVVVVWCRWRLVVVRVCSLCVVACGRLSVLFVMCWWLLSLSVISCSSLPCAVCCFVIVPVELHFLLYVICVSPFIFVVYCVALFVVCLWFVVRCTFFVFVRLLV